jgi:hypothetical protein
MSTTTTPPPPHNTVIPPNVQMRPFTIENMLGTVLPDEPNVRTKLEKHKSYVTFLQELEQQLELQYERLDKESPPLYRRCSGCNRLHDHALAVCSLCHCTYYW